MSLIKTPKEIATLREGGVILAAILEKIAGAVKPGISTMDLDVLARQEVKKAGVRSAFEGYRMAGDSPAYPAVICASIDDEVVHGIPSSSRILREGEIIGIDFGIVYQSLYTDAAVTVPVGSVSAEKQKLIDVTRLALEKGLEQVAPGRTIGDIAAAVQSEARKAGFGVIRDLVGHGVGHALHEKPDVPNCGKKGSLQKLETGMVIAIEPMFTLGDWQIYFAEDGWTVKTLDGSASAHFEHSVAVTASGYLTLTA